MKKKVRYTCVCVYLHGDTCIRKTRNVTAFYLSIYLLLDLKNVTNITTGVINKNNIFE